RMRAAAKAQGPGTSQANIGVPINDPSITWAKYTISPYPAFADQASARLAVRTERRLALAMEGQRFFDLRRWGVMQTTLAAYINGVGGGAAARERGSGAAGQRECGNAGMRECEAASEANSFRGRFVSAQDPPGPTSHPPSTR